MHFRQSSQFIGKELQGLLAQNYIKLAIQKGKIFCVTVMPLKLRMLTWCLLTCNGEHVLVQVNTCDGPFCSHHERGLTRDDTRSAPDIQKSLARFDWQVCKEGPSQRPRDIGNLILLIALSRRSSKLPSLLGHISSPAIVRLDRSQQRPKKLSFLNHD